MDNKSGSVQFRPCLYLSTGRKLTSLYSICRPKPILGVDAGRKHVSDPNIPCG